MVHTSPVSQLAKLKDVEKSNDDVVLRVSSKKKMPSGTEGMPPQIMSRTTALLEKSPSAKYRFIVESKIPHIMISNNSKDKEPTDVNKEMENAEVMENFDEEVSLAKLKLIIRYVNSSA